jgi:HEAT repeat protein
MNPSSPAQTPRTRHPNDTRLGPTAAAKVLVFFVTWLAVVGGFYLWRGTHRTQADLGTRLQDTANPKTVQDATIELAARMKQHDAEAKRWYPTLLTMAESSSPEQRGIAAWIMANDASNHTFHQVLLRLAKDPSPSVRANAAVSLEKFKDPVGRQTILEMVQAPDASPDQQWEALRALRVIGTKDDLPMAERFANSSEKRIREAAREAAQGIRDRT